MLNKRERTRSLFRWTCRRWTVKIKSVKEIVHGVEFTVTWRENVERKLNTCKTIKQVDSLAPTTKPKASMARANLTKARTKASLARAKAWTKAKEKVNNTARNERNDFTGWRGTKTKRKHKPVKNTQGGLTRVGITLTNGMTQIGGRVQICGLILRGSKRQDSCHRHSRLKTSPTRHKAETFRC